MKRHLPLILVVIIVFGVLVWEIALIRAEPPGPPPPTPVVYMSQNPERIVWVTNYVQVAVYTLSDTDNRHNERVLKAALAGAEMGWKWAHWGSSKEAVSNSVVQTWEYLFKGKP